MHDHTVVSKAFVVASCALAIAFLIISMAFTAAWAGSATGNYSKRIITAQGCLPNSYACPSGLNQQCCGGLACILISVPNVNNTPQFQSVCFPSRNRGEACSADNECSSGACDANRTAPVDPTGNNFHYGLCE